MKTPRLILAAILCGVLPLLFGNFVYFSWRITRWEPLEIAGMFTVLFGSLAVLAGLVCLSLYQRRGARRGEAEGAAAVIQSRLPLGLLLINFPVAAVLMFSAHQIVSRYRVTVINESAAPIESFVITGPGFSEEMGPIQAGRKRSVDLFIKGEGSAVFSARQGDAFMSAALDGYIESGDGRDRTVRILPGGKFEIEREP